MKQPRLACIAGVSNIGYPVLGNVGGAGSFHLAFHSCEFCLPLTFPDTGNPILLIQVPVTQATPALKPLTILC